MSQTFVAYYRVSTASQGRSGLGLDAQRLMIAECVQRLGGVVTFSFEEIESGKRHENRPELRKALALAKRSKAILIVAKLDRLARNVAFISQLLDTPGVEFLAADCPDASRMFLQMMAVFSEYERGCISSRTKDALAARKARGFTLGNLANLNRGGSNIAQVNKARAQAEAERLRPTIASLQSEGITTVRAICRELNGRGYVTERGCAWHPASVSKVLSRL